MAVALIVSAVPFAVAADDAGNAPTITVSSSEAKPGDTVEVEISLENNPGIVSMRIYCDYDSDALTLVEAVDADQLGDSTFKNVYEAPYVMFWFNPTSYSNYTANGVVATLTFKVADNADAGDYDIAISYNKGDIINFNLRNVAFEIEDGVIEVEGSGSGSGSGNTNNSGTGTGSGSNNKDDKDDEDFDIEFESDTFTYDGKRKSLKVTGLPDGADVEYDNNGKREVGTYTVKATITTEDGDTIKKSARLTIEPRELTIEDLTAEDKIYDGKTDAVLTGGELEGIVGSDDVYITMPTKGEFEDEQVGKNKDVTFEKPRLRGDDADNYELEWPIVLSADIIAAPGVTTPTTPTTPTKPETPKDDETTTPVTTPTPWQNPFTDVTMNDWYYTAVKYASENGIMNGVSADSFNPDGDITRSMFVTVLYRIAGQPASAKSAFTDIVSGSWYEAAVNWASANGIVNGTSATTFAPDTVITREQMATIIYRFASYKKYDLTTSQTRIFADGAEIADYAREAMNWAADKGLITGSGDGTVTPKANASRAQAATILQRMVEKLG